MGKKKISNGDINETLLPIIVLENYVLTPQIPQPVKIDDEEQRIFLNQCNGGNAIVFFATAEITESKSKEENIRKTGVVCSIDKILQMPGAPTLVFVRPLYRGHFKGMVYSPAFPMAKVSKIENIEEPKRKSLENKYLIERIEKLFRGLMNYLAEPEKESAEKLVKENSHTTVSYIYSISHVSPLSWDEKYKILEASSYKELLETEASMLDQAEQRIHLQASIHEKTHHELSQQQKETFLRIHLKQIKEELGENEENDDVSALVKKAEKKIWNNAAKEHFNKELRKLKRLNVNNPDYAVQYSYLDTLLDLPWENYKKHKLSLEKVEQVLNRDHFGLEKVKERVIEHMAVLKLRNDLKAPILCLYGPPGVGKTSIGKSIAEATGREYSRIALGGMHDEAEIRGHRRTYIGAMPGRFLHALSKLKYGNPLVLLDEIDKVGNDYKGDPSSALLEALDPEQNHTFHDNFIDFPYDLSKVLFIATANDLSTIPAPLRDRMEIIEMTGYIPEEKKQIALNHLMSKILKENGFKGNEISFTPEALETIILFYTHEAGVRQLEKKISKIIRKLAKLKATGKEFPTIIDGSNVEQFLGKKEYHPETYENNDFAGVATGLAWTPAGGDVLFIETSLSPGKGEKITLTGNLGDVMKESAIIALQYLKAHAKKFGLKSDIFNRFDVHIHVPEGAVPKDGPSAGITLATSLLSAFSGNKIREKTAMTGELTLRGKVVPVGGIKEKIIAARQAGIKRIILSERNRHDIEEIQPQYIEGLEFIYVNNLEEVFQYALSEEKAKYNFELEDT